MDNQMTMFVDIDAINHVRTMSNDYRLHECGNIRTQQCNGYW